MSGMRGYLRYMLALAASVGLGVPVIAQDRSDLAAGQNAWNRAGCYNCHGSRAQGGDGGDYPMGPALMTTALDKETMMMIVSCGLPGTPIEIKHKILGENAARLYGINIARQAEKLGQDPIGQELARQA